MAIKFQYNKTSLQQLEKQLKMRVRTLPIIKNKESALRMEVKKCKAEAAELARNLEVQIQAYEAMFALWSEFDPTRLLLIWELLFLCPRSFTHHVRICIEMWMESLKIMKFI